MQQRPRWTACGPYGYRVDPVGWDSGEYLPLTRRMSRSRRWFGQRPIAEARAVRDFVPQLRSGRRGDCRGDRPVGVDGVPRVHSGQRDETPRAPGAGPLPPTGSPTKRVQSLTHATAELRHDGWNVSLVAVLESSDRYRHLQATGGYSFTHVGQLTRIDDSAFAVQQAEKILESLRVFLSFARGAACSLPIRWGRGIDGEIVWRQFGSPIVDRWRQRLSWFDEIHGEVLTELFDAFCQVHNDQRLRESLVRGLHWYRHCNTSSSGKEGSLVLGMAALDLLSALIVVGRCRSMSAQEHDRLGAARKLRALLKALDVPADIPSRYAALTAFAEKNGRSDSCAALAKLRHGFVHANEKRRNVVSGSDDKAAVFDAWQLSLWYQELALLRLLRHRGSYRNRTTAKRVGQVQL